MRKRLPERKMSHKNRDCRPGQHKNVAEQLFLLDASVQEHLSKGAAKDFGDCTYPSKGWQDTNRPLNGPGRHAPEVKGVVGPRAHASGCA
jgi:hypothetical protein